MTELIKPKVLLIVEDDPKQFEALDKVYGIGAFLTAYERFGTQRNPSTAYTKEYFNCWGTREGEGSTSLKAKREIRENIARKHQDAVKQGYLLVSMARTYREFKSELELGLDGVVLDMHFPLDYQEPWNKPQPLGIKAALELEERKIPFIINTAWNHHGADSQWIFEMVRERNWPMNEVTESADKDWLRVMQYIIKEIRKDE